MAHLGGEYIVHDGALRVDGEGPGAELDDGDGEDENDDAVEEERRHEGEAYLHGVYREESHEESHPEEAVDGHGDDVQAESRERNRAQEAPCVLRGGPFK